MRRPGRRQRGGGGGNARARALVHGNPLNFSPFLWLRADLGITIATGVSAWADQSGNGRNLTQGTGVKQPVVTSAAINGQPSITFDGSNDALAATGFGIVQPTDIYFVMKFMADPGAFDKTFIDGAGTGNTMRVYRNGGTSNPGHVSMFAGTGINGSTGTPDSWHYYRVQFNGASSQIDQDGASQVTGNCGANNGGGLTLGAFGDQTIQWANVSFTEVVLFSRLLTTAEKTLLNSYFKARYAL